MYEDPNFDETSTAETIAGRAGQVTGFALPIVGTAGALLKGGKAARTAYQEGHLLTSITDKAVDVFHSAKDTLFTPGSKVADEADTAIPKVVKPSKAPQELSQAEVNSLWAQHGNKSHSQKRMRPRHIPGSSHTLGDF